MMTSIEFTFIFKTLTPNFMSMNCTSMSIQLSAKVSASQYGLLLAFYPTKSAAMLHHHLICGSYTGTVV
jgi:hypothetical protein